MKSKKKLFKDLEEINSVRFKGVELDSKLISNETYGKNSFIYVRSESREDRTKIERELEKRGHKVERDYWRESSTTSVQVSYFKGWHWDE